MRAAETLEDITAEASITKTGEGTEKLEKVTGENGEVSYQITATPGTGQKLKGITVNGTEVTGTVAAGGHIHLKIMDKLKLRKKFILVKIQRLIQMEII